MGRYYMSWILLAILRCPFPAIHGNVPDPIIQRAAEVCFRKYNGCTVSITEVGDQSYRVICRRYPPPASRIAYEELE